MNARLPLSRGPLAVLAVLALALVSAAPSTENHVRYLAYPDVDATVRLFAGSGLPGSDIADAAAWDTWIRDQDHQVRARIDRGVEDSISNLILFGTSFTTLHRLEGTEQSLTDSSEISASARARVHALVVALNAASPNERVRFVREYLAKTGVKKDQTEEFLTANLKRFALEQRDYAEKLDEAGKSPDPTNMLLTRGTLYQNRGLSVDTSLLPNYAVEDTLRALVTKGALASRKIRRIAVVGPGLDFTDKRDGYDFYPLQTVQPFAILEAVLRTGAGNAPDLDVTTFDLNPAVNAHIARLANNARAGRAYVVQLPRDTRADWSPAALAYWEHFGDILGTHVKPLPVPQSLGEVATRAIAVAPRFASRITPLDMNIVTQTLDLPESQHFDLVVATNILVYYDRFQQSLALASVARILSPGGVFISNTLLPAQHDPQLEFLGRRAVIYSSSGSYGDDIVVYRRR